MVSTGILIIIAIILISYFLSLNSSKGVSVPTQYKGAEGLDYIRKSYGGQLSQAESLCTGQFRGNWIDYSNEIGCRNMQSFSTTYCSMSSIKNLADLCKSIGGTSICSSTEASCSV
jgi:hypothetical protein